MTSTPLSAPAYEPGGALRQAWKQLRATVEFRPLVRFLVSASLRTENVGTMFGYLWWLIDPLLLMGAYVVLVDVILRSGVENFPLFVFAAVIPWKYFQAGTRNAIAVTASKERQMRQVAFPKAVLPISAILAETVRFAVGLAVVVVFAAAFGILLHYTLPLVVVVVAVQFAFTLGVAFFLSALNVFFRDVQHVTTHLFVFWFFLSPGLYPVSAVPERFRALYELNPFATIFPAYRSIIIDHEVPDLPALGLVGAFSLLLMAGGFLFFTRVERSFAKVN